MNLAELTEPQKAALLDLLVIGMYSDGHLSSAEDDRIQRLLGQFGFESNYARQQFVDASFTRSSRHTQNSELLRSRLKELAACFPTLELRRASTEVLHELLASDARLTPEEDRYLTLVKEVFAA